MFHLATLDELPALGTLAVVTLLHELGVPVPMSPAALFAGARAAAGAIDPVLPVVAIVVATLIGNAVWFAAGRRYGLQALRLPSRLSLALGNYTLRGIDTFDRWGPWLLVIGRFVPGASLVAPALAGAARMQWSTFLLLTATGAALHAIAIVGAGMLLRQQVESALDSLLRFGGYGLAALAVALSMALLWRWRSNASAVPAA